MASSSTVAVSSNTVATIIGWMAFGLSIASVSSSSWRTAPGVRIGLWIGCADTMSTSGCTSLSGLNQGEMNAVNKQSAVCAFHCCMLAAWPRV